MVTGGVPAGLVPASDWLWLPRRLLVTFEPSGPSPPPPPFLLLPILPVLANQHETPPLLPPGTPSSDQRRTHDTHLDRPLSMVSFFSEIFIPFRPEPD